MAPALVWLGIAVLFAVIELFTLDLLFLMLAGGALAGALTSVFDSPVWLQIVIACLVGAALVFLVRPPALRWMAKRHPHRETGVAALVGQHAVVVLPVTEAGGRIKLAGEVWTAKSDQSGLEFAVGDDVEVVEISGATAVVAAPKLPNTQSVEGQL